MKLIGTTLLILSLVLPVVAQDRRNGARNLREMDTDHDGKISRDEWKGRSEVFARLDTNNDGFITSNELQQVRRNIAEGLKNMDSDKDGRISQQEWRGPSEMFTRLDSDNDGFITRDELRQVRQNRQNRRNPEARGNQQD